jgi:hypothetical protein
MLTSEQSLFANIEEALVPLNLQADVGEEFPWVPLLMSVSQLEEHTTYDSETVYLDLITLGGECFSTYSGTFLGEGEADIRWLTSLDETRWLGDDETRWSVGDVVVEGIHC